MFFLKPRALKFENVATMRNGQEPLKPLGTSTPCPLFSVITNNSDR